MNKRDLIDAISGRLGDKKSATEAVNAVLEAIQSAVASGDKVAITGFGVFEKSERPARTARNPATGATIQVPKSSVPRFRAGADFKALVNGEKAAGKLGALSQADGRGRHPDYPGRRPRPSPASGLTPGPGSPRTGLTPGPGSPPDRANAGRTACAARSG